MRCERVFRIIAVGKMRDRQLAAKCDELLKWITKYGKCELSVIPDSDIKKESQALVKELEHEKNAVKFVLSEEGVEWSTVQFASKLEAVDRKIVFVIGGPFGMDDAVKQRADHLWSLSKLTFTHEMARLLLCEQIFRAMNHLNGGTYHHI